MHIKENAPSLKNTILIMRLKKGTQFLFNEVNIWEM